MLKINTKKMQINSAKELKVYKKAYSLAMKIFEISKTFPKEGEQRSVVRGQRPVMKLNV